MKPISKKRKIELHGSLKDLYPGDIRLSCATPAEAIRGLTVQIKGFEKALRAGTFRVVRGNDLDSGNADIDHRKIHCGLGNADTLHIIPVIEGAKNGGFGKIILGVALIGLSFANPAALAGFATGTSASEAALLGAAGASHAVSIATAVLSGAAKLGFSLLIGGISQVFSPQPKNDFQTGQVDQRASFLFNGAVNVSEQGGPIPLLYGELVVGTVVIASGLDVEANAANTSTSSNAIFIDSTGAKS